MIYYLADSLSRGGGGRIASDILSSILAPGREITVVSTDRCQLPSELDGEPVSSPRWVTPPSPKGYAGRQNAWPKVLARRMVVRAHDTPRRFRLERALRRTPPALTIHNGFPKPGRAYTEILERSANRLILVHSSPEAFDFFRRGDPDWTLEWLSQRLRDAGSLIFASPQIRDDWSSIAGLTQKRIFVVSGTTREDDVQEVMARSRIELRRSLDLPEDVFLVSCVAKLDTSKGQDVLIKALPKMLEVKPELHVVFVGPSTRFGLGFPEEARALGVAEHLTFAGSRDDAYSFIRASDMLIHPSLAEGQGLVVLEAMVLQTPVLATCVGGIPFSIEHGISGWLVPPNDPEAIAAGFKTLVQNHALRERLASAAETRYWENFSRLKHRAHMRSIMELCLTTDSDT